MTYKSGDQPDPEFAAFFAGDWQRLLENVVVPGIDGPAWDRRAAYLYWELAITAKAGWDSLDYEGGGRPDKVNTPLTEWIAEETAGLMAPAPINWDQVLAVPLVGSGPYQRAQLLNHLEDDDCEPTPGGVSLPFDSSKHGGEPNG